MALSKKDIRKIVNFVNLLQDIVNKMRVFSFEGK